MLKAQIVTTYKKKQKCLIRLHKTLDILKTNESNFTNYAPKQTVNLTVDVNKTKNHVDFSLR